MLDRRASMVILGVVAVTVAAVGAAVVIALGSTTPSGAATVPDDVALQYAKYVEHKYPAAGKAEPGFCFRRRKQPRRYKGFPIFGCTVTQKNGTTVSPRLQCVASTDKDFALQPTGRRAGPQGAAQFIPDRASSAGRHGHQRRSGVTPEHSRSPGIVFLCGEVIRDAPQESRQF